MASYVTPLVHATGDLFAVTDNNALANNEVFLYQRPYAMAYNSVVTSLTSATITQVSLGGLVASNYGISISSNNIIVPLTGIYQVDCAVAIATNATASTQLLSFVKQNGTIVLTGSFAPIRNTSKLSVTIRSMPL